MNIFIVEARGCEWSRPLLAYATRPAALQAIAEIRDYMSRAPAVDWDSHDADKVTRQINRLERYEKRGPGGEGAKGADDFIVVPVPAFGLTKS